MSKEVLAKGMDDSVRFSPEVAIHLAMLAIMVLSIALALNKYFGWGISAAIGVALSYVFSALAKTVVAPVREATLGERVWAGAFALGILGVTLGLSYSTLYAMLFAQSSALGEFQRVRGPIQRQIETAVLANAEASVKAFAAWNRDASKKAEQEGKGGGTCPARAGSLGKRGPIAMWREGDAGVAANLEAELRSIVSGIRFRFDAVRDRKAATFGEAMEITTALNGVIEESEALSRGSYVNATREVLSRQLAREITWPNGEVFRCGDTARDELIRRALAALADLSDMKRNPPIQRLAPAIDLANEQEVTVRGLLRSFNAIAAVLTFGRVGTFVDDPLMEEALRSRGLINRETIGFLLAGLVELSVLFTSFLCVRAGESPFPLRPAKTLANWELRATRQKTWIAQAATMLAIGVVKLFVNLLFTRPHATGSADANVHARNGAPVETPDDPDYPPRELEWGVLLAPYFVSNHDGDYFVVPNITRCARPLMAASALEFQRAVVRLNLDVPWATIAGHRLAAERLQRLLPDAANLRFAVYKLQPAFGQAMRLRILQPTVQRRSSQAAADSSAQEATREAAR